MKTPNWANQFLCGIIVLFQFAAMSDQPYSTPLRHDFPKNLYFGDTHIHTKLSSDAYRGGTRLGPEEAYRFARGEEVISSMGPRARLARPLDFIVVADHANNMGTMMSRDLSNTNDEFQNSTLGKLWLEALDELKNRPGIDLDKLVKGYLSPGHGGKNISVEHEGFRNSIWKDYVETADRFNEPGHFTAFIGYEWTSQSALDRFENPDGLWEYHNLHRVVIFREGADVMRDVLPFTSFDSLDPERLWEFMDHYESTTGGSVLAIPHNSNLSLGSMFALHDSEGEPFTQDYARSRARWEPLVEATQVKGDSEAHPFLSPNDEFADFETWNGWAGRENGGIPWRGARVPWRDESLIEFEYVRSALKLGLQQQAELGTNPFKFGLIGSTDGHTGLAGIEEDNFWGKQTPSEPKPGRVQQFGATSNWQLNSGGYAAVWARENTRESIYDAMQRKEVYSTTGPRISVRFFGGWDFQDEDSAKPNLAEVGYKLGVPMGGDLTNAPKKMSPTFLIQAVKDPQGANLDRVQIIKGWHDKKGRLHEKVFNVALSDNRRIRRGGEAALVGNTVDIDSASYTNTIGDPELATVWKDPDFKKNELAFYYLRVLEIPTPRWTAYDAKHYNLTDLAEEIVMTTQERAYTSPIWYTP